MKLFNRLFLTFLMTFNLILFLHSCSIKKNEKNKTLRMGYMPNITHAHALIGIEKKIFQNEIGHEIMLKPMHFVVGNSIIDAFITNQIDIAYVGPGPFINAIYRRVPVKLLANATNGGTLIVVKKESNSISENMRIAVPQYGNTQDLLLRKYLEKENLSGKVKIFAVPSQDTATTFFTMSIDAACLPEPWGTILIQRKICNVFCDEKTILNNGNYPVAVLIVNKKYEKENPELIRRFLSAHAKINRFLVNNPEESIKLVTKSISDISKKQIDEIIIRESFKRCIFNENLNLNILKEYKAVGVRAGYYREGFINEDNFN